MLKKERRRQLHQCNAMSITEAGRRPLFPAHSINIYRVGQKTAHGFLCYNFAYSQSVFIIFGTYTTHYRKFATGWCIVSPPNTVCVTTLPCEISNHNFIHVHFYSLFQKCFQFTLVIIAIFQIFINIIFERIVPDDY